MRKNVMQEDFKLLPIPGHMEFNNEPSMTVPDETLSIKEIVKKHVRGQRIAEDLMRQPVFDSGADFDSDDLEKLRDEDIFDRETKLDSIKEKIEENKQKQKSFFQQKKDEKQKSTRASEGATEDEYSEDDKKSQKPKPQTGQKPTQKDDRREDDQGREKNSR